MRFNLHLIIISHYIRTINQQRTKKRAFSAFSFNNKPVQKKRLSGMIFDPHFPLLPETA